jgi:hypothetical protein
MADELAAPPSDQTATVIVMRTSKEDVGFREVFVTLDGQEIGILQSGDSVTRDVTPGSHELRAHNTLMRKREQFDLKAGETATFLAVNKAGAGTFSILSLLGAGPLYLTLERIPNAG